MQHLPDEDNLVEHKALLGKKLICYSLSVLMVTQVCAFLLVSPLLVFYFKLLRAFFEE